MSGSEQYEKVSISSDGVTVDKRFEEDEFPVPAIAFEIQSSRSETVTVVLVDDVPEDVAVEDLGFHPEYGSEYWTIDEEQITFEREIEADSSYTTVYGIRATGTEDVEKFLTEPVIESVDPPLAESDDSVVDEGGSDVVRDVISGDSDAVPGLEDEEDDDVETLDLKDPNEPDSATSDGDSGGDAGGDSGGSSGSAEIDSIVGAMAAEMRNGNVDEDDVKLLRKAFDVVDDGAGGGSVDARIQRLQTEVSDLLAYTDALEEFLDENGTAEQTIEEFRQEVEGMESDLQEVQQLAQSHEGVISEVESTVEGVEQSMNSLEAEMDDVVQDVEAVQGDVSSVEGTVSEMEGTVDDVEGTVSEMEGTVDDVEGSIDEVESSVEDLEGTVENLESQMGDIDVEEVKSDIEEINSEIEELKEWREQLSSVIGGGGD
jgi:predicted  nucleic acid-binding Zn-ribbon protein